MTLYLGLMSGTSMDGIDAALLDIAPGGMRLIAAAGHDWPAPLRERLRHAAEHPERTDLAELGRLDTEAGLQFALAAEALLRTRADASDAVRAIGSHGQTLLHRPAGQAPFTLQIGDPNLIAERLGIDVVADFRRRDIAAGGEGAPLMPAFHAAAFGVTGQLCAVVNIGGIANVTLIGADGAIVGFDTGPGNCLLDAWSRRHRAAAYDAAGRWAASGQVQPQLLARLLAEPYFARPAPKSTGRDVFSDLWLERMLEAAAIAAGTASSPVDVQATLAELTARSIADGLRQAATQGVAMSAAGPTQVMVCGGGAFNTDLMARLQRALPQSRLATTAAAGIAPEHVEAAGFAWLAYRAVSGQPGNVPSVTGARHPVPLGALYRAR